MCREGKRKLFLRIAEAISLKVTFGGHKVYIPIFRQNYIKIKLSQPICFNKIKDFRYKSLTFESLVNPMILSIAISCLFHLGEV